MKFSKIMSVALSSMMLLTSAGCGIKSNNGNKMEKITVWTNSGGTKSVMLELVDEFNNTIGKEKGINISYEVYGGDYTQTCELAFTNGQEPDLFLAQGKLSNYVDKGYILPLADFKGMEEFLEKYSENDLRDFTVDGKVYAVPTIKTVKGLIYNKDLFKQAGIVDEQGEPTPPKTWDEIAKYAKRISDLSEDVYGIIMPMKWNAYWSYDFPAADSGAVGAYNRVDDKYDYEFYRKPLKALLQIKADNSFYPGPEGIDNDPARALFAEGVIGMKFAASWDVGVLNDQFPAKCDWDVVQVPAQNAEDIDMYYPSAGVEAAFEIASGAKNKDPEKIAEVYKFLCGDEVYTKLYEEGTVIPYRNECMIGAKKVSDAKGWVGFGKIAQNSKSRPTWVSLKIEGESTSDLLNKVWYGTMTIDEFIKNRNELANEAYQKGLAEGTLDRLDYYKSIPVEAFDSTKK